MRRIDELKRCPKCGYPEFYYHFRSIPDWQHKTINRERIEATCKRCDYLEICHPLDAEKQSSDCGWPNLG